MGKRRLWVFGAAVLFGAAMLLTGCAKDLAVDGPQIDTRTEAEAATRAQVDAMAQVRAAAVEMAVYHEPTDSWIAQLGDPYRLENFQKAYDRLAKNGTVKQLQATHYALKIYPKTEEEQNKIESDKEVQVAYIPLDHIRLTEAEVARKARTRTEATTFGEVSPYTVTYDHTDATDGGPTGPVTVQLPILYTVWPVEKPLPVDMEYVVDYEVFLPRAATEQAELLRALEDEAIAEAFGVPVPVREAPVTRAIPNPTTKTFRAYLMTYDSTVGKNAPLANMKIQHQTGSNIVETSTNANGLFSVTRKLPLQAIDDQMNIVYEDPANRWKIMPDANTSVPITAFADAPYYDYEVISLTSTSHQETSIHRAVNYFFNGQNHIPKGVPSGGTSIVAYSVSNRASGYFTPSFGSLIGVYNNGKSNGSVIGTVLHELGHLAHYLNNNPQFNSTDNFLKEAFASCVGWYLGRLYYTSLGWINPGGDPQIAGTSRQDWYKTNGNYEILSDNKKHYLGWYSPLFIDLIDNYNQGANNATYPNDKIQGMQISSVWSIITNSTTYYGIGQCRERIVNLAGTSSDFNAWIGNFDYWASTYPLELQ